MVYAAVKAGIKGTEELKRGVYNERRNIKNNVSINKSPCLRASLGFVWRPNKGAIECLG